jgi:sulfoxide reductase heme-binding subunit YedZ
VSDQLLWYTTRGAGAVTLVLLSAVVVLGIGARNRFSAPRWPRFLSAAVHNDLALLSLAFLAVHIVSAVVDPFTHLGIAALIPFASYYRTFWLGLGALALELVLALIVTSLLRRHIGAPAWRAVHWVAYFAWPIAVLHGIGTGTDASSWWILAITVVCAGAVLAAAVWRLGSAPDPLEIERRASAQRARGSAP